MKKLLVVLLTCTILPICMANNRGMKTVWQDNNTSYQAQYQLNNDTMLHNQKGVVNISVATFNHVVLLVGQAPTQEFKQQAENIVSQISNVKLIYNQITVAPPVSATTQSEDTWITTKVKSTMLFAKGLDSNKIKVITEDHVVYLMGATSQQQGVLAAQVASQISGVKKIVKIFEYTN